MSQYPPPPPSSPPQQQPSYGYDFSYYQPQVNVLAPARRASGMMFVLGVLLAIGALCCGGTAVMVPMEEMIAQQPALSTMPGVTADVLQVGLIVLAVLGFLFGTVLLVLGYFVRGGSTVPVIIALVLVALATLLNVLNLAYTAIQSSRAPGAEMTAALCVNVVPLVLLLTLLVWLVQAAKAAPRIAMMKSQYEQQYWQYQQQQQMYQAGYLAPPVASSPPPGPLSADDSSREGSNSA